jgi:hypothetical protein
VEGVALALQVKEDPEWARKERRGLAFHRPGTIEVASTKLAHVEGVEVRS